jgi:hypothetical protein
MGKDNMPAESELALTEAIVTTATYDTGGPRLQYLWDTRAPGFGIRLSASGEKSYVVGYRLRPSSRMRFDVIGKVEQWKVRRARDQARVILLKRKDSMQATPHQKTAKTLPNHAERSTARDQRQAERRVLDRRDGAVRALAVDPQLPIVDDLQKLVRFRGRQIRLTRKEFTLFKLLASEPGRVFSSEEIIELAWPGKKRASAEDVQQYIHLLRRKIETNPKQPQLIVTVSGFGYEFESPEPE